MKSKTMTAILAAIALFAGVLIGACGEPNTVQASNDYWEMEQISTDVDENFYIFRDSETGVHYIYVSAGGGSFCPRYNSDGTLYVD